jgi:hypothetical protein
MNAIMNIKLKSLLTLVLGIQVMILPFCIYFYFVHKISPGSAFLHLLTGILLAFQAAVMINEYIFKRIFYTLLRGKIIKSRYDKKVLLPFFLYTVLIFIIWILFFIIHEPGFIQLSYALPLFAVFYSNQFYLISDGFLVTGLWVIPLDLIKWYTDASDNKAGKLVIHCRNNRTFSLKNDPYCISKVADYLEAQKAIQEATDESLYYESR